MDSFWIAVQLLVNTLATGIVAVHAMCNLSTRQWRMYEPQLWVYLILLGGASWSVLAPIYDRSHAHTQEVAINVGLALWVLSGWPRVRRAADASNRFINPADFGLRDQQPNDIKR